MAKKAKNKRREVDFDPYDDVDDLYVDELDLKELSRDVYRTEWGDDYLENEERFSVRRKIERRNDMRKLYSQLDEFEPFGERIDW